MGDLSTAALGRTDVTGRIYPEGEVLPPQAAEIVPLPPGLAAPGIPLDDFRPGDPLFETAQEARRVQAGRPEPGHQARL